MLRQTASYTFRASALKSAKAKGFKCFLHLHAFCALSACITHPYRHLLAASNSCICMIGIGHIHELIWHMLHVDAVQSRLHCQRAAQYVT